MKFTTLFLALAPTVSGFVAPQTSGRTFTLQATADENVNDTSSSPLSTRRDAFKTAFSGAALAGLTFLPSLSSPAFAVEGEIKNVVVAGATGQTGSRIFERLNAQSFITTGGVRNVAKATKSLKPKKDNLSRLDVVEDSIDTLANTLSGAGAEGLIIAVGFNPGKNLLRMSTACHEVDNVGTIKLIDAAKKAGVKKVVLVSSILTNGREWGQEESPGFVITNVFGNSLDEKIIAEKYLRSSGLDYTIVRPGGLKGTAPTGQLAVYGEDKLNSGEISRDLVADVCVAALNDAKTTNKVLEIIEDDGKPPQVFNGIVM